MLRSMCPSLPTIVSVPEMLTIYVIYYIGLLPLMPVRADVFGFPSDKVDYARIRQ